MDYFINPYLWMFGASFSCAKFFSWLLSSIENNILKRMREKRKAKKILLWLGLMVVFFILVAVVSFQNPFPVKTATIFFFSTFFPLFLVFLYPKLFVTPMVIILLVISAIFADLRTSWIHADVDVLSGSPLFEGKFLEENPQKYHFYTPLKSIRPPLDLKLDISSSAKYLDIEMIEIHSLPIWFLWWTNNYFCVQRITDNFGNVLWEKPIESPIFRYLVHNRWGWVSRKDSVRVELVAPASIYWRAYNWRVDYPMKAIPVEEEMQEESPGPMENEYEPSIASQT